MSLLRATLLAATAVITLLPAIAQAADPVGCAYPDTYRKHAAYHAHRHHHRHHIHRHHGQRHHARRVVVASWAPLECGLLRVTDAQGSRLVKVCHPPVF
ncbi:hypothetical protein BJF92_04670 [Rhizobium rhizosphaerae]|uniref:Uncharacterized protein n=1 Tax=Xaviernesmea rhizosphaerae TaxID=1672749 RepID=A0A1Q9AG84_9HYPH|nr:hypothetical protein [Xaviernesmea rhizosphaerae]OLP53879.1 hypothetical protein BJF92_04670 [Xaviernesmea rhizosphaerae]OQP88114.1 hypothetical protein BTR14_01180 [Xaviernesmea rhizosphaerae]